MLNYKNVFVGLLLLFYKLNNSNAANILCVVGIAEHSMPEWTQPLFEALAARGHRLTIFSTAHYAHTIANASYINLVNNYDVIGRQYIDAGTGAYRHYWPFKHMLIWHEAQLGSCRELVNSDGFIAAIKQLRNAQQQYDLIIYDGTYGTDCLLSLTQLQASTPIMAVSGAKLNSNIFDLAQAQSTLSPAAVPHFTSSFPVEMNYWQRLHNHVLYFAESVLKKFIVSPVRGSMVPNTVDTPQKRIKLILLNTHPALDYIQPLPACVVEVGGLHLKPATEVQTLPNTLLEFVAEYEDGLIYIDLEYLQLFTAESLKAISEVINEFSDYGFLWRLDRQHKKILKLEKMPANLYIIEQQLDRQTILALPNMKVILSHADSFGMLEAASYGVPILGLPLILEQFNNAQRLQERHLGKALIATSLSKAELSDNLRELLHNQLYANKLQSVRKSFRKSPLQAAVSYAEQLIEDSDSFDILNSENSVKLNYFVRHSWDIALLPIVFMIMFCYNVYFLVSQLMKNAKKDKDANKSVRQAIIEKVKQKQVKRDKKESKKEAKKRKNN